MSPLRALGDRLRTSVPWPKLTLWLGYLITAASLLYLLRDLQLHAGSLPGDWMQRYASGWFGVSVLLFVCSVSCGFLIWRRLLVWEGAGMALLPAANVYLVSQIGKYIPGNVAQHFGRVVLASRQGMAAATTARLIVIEIVVVVSAALFFVTAICLFQPDMRTQLLAIFAARRSPATLVMVALLAGAVVLGGAAALARLVARAGDGGAFTALGLPRLLQLLALGFLAFMALGASFHVLLAKCLMVADPGLLACIAGSLRAGSSAS